MVYRLSYKEDSNSRYELVWKDVELRPDKDGVVERAFD